MTFFLLSACLPRLQKETRSTKDESSLPAIYMRLPGGRCKAHECYCVTTNQETGQKAISYCRPASNKSGGFEGSGVQGDGSEATLAHQSSSVSALFG